MAGTENGEPLEYFGEHDGWRELGHDGERVEAGGEEGEFAVEAPDPDETFAVPIPVPDYVTAHRIAHLVDRWKAERTRHKQAKVDLKERYAGFLGPIFDLDLPTESEILNSGRPVEMNEEVIAERHKVLAAAAHTLIKNGILDPDDLRAMLEDLTGASSQAVQNAVASLVNDRVVEFRSGTRQYALPNAK